MAVAEGESDRVGESERRTRERERTDESGGGGAVAAGCLVMSDASPCVCDNHLAPCAVVVVAGGGAASETEAPSYMC